jgi:hypothetical protein
MGRIPGGGEAHPDHRQREVGDGPEGVARQQAQITTVVGMWLSGAIFMEK